MHESLREFTRVYMRSLEFQVMPGASDQIHRELQWGPCALHKSPRAFTRVCERFLAFISVSCDAGSLESDSTSTALRSISIALESTSVYESLREIRHKETFAYLSEWRQLNAKYGKFFLGRDTAASVAVTDMCRMRFVNSDRYSGILLSTELQE